jgi:(2Fe-2S) ferredoxin
VRRIYVDVGGLTCPKKGSREVLEALKDAIHRAGLDAEVEVIPRGCFGLCRLAPNMYVEPDGIWYSRFSLNDVEAIVREHLCQNQPVQRLIHYRCEPVPCKDAPTSFVQKEKECRDDRDTNPKRD